MNALPPSHVFGEQCQASTTTRAFVSPTLHLPPIAIANRELQPWQYQKDEAKDTTGRSPACTAVNACYQSHNIAETRETHLTRKATSPVLRMCATALRQHTTSVVFDESLRNRHYPPTSTFVLRAYWLRTCRQSSYAGIPTVHNAPLQIRAAYKTNADQLSQLTLNLHQIYRRTTITFASHIDNIANPCCFIPVPTQRWADYQLHNKR